MLNLVKYYTIIVVLYFFSSAAFADKHITPKELSFGVVSDSSIQSSVNNFYDINIEYLENILGSQGISVKIDLYPTVSRLLEAVELGKIDGAVGFSHTPLREERFLFSKPFFNSGVAAWYVNPEFKNVAIRQLNWVCVNESVYCDYLNKINPHSIIRVGHIDQAMRMVLEGRADAVVSSYVSISSYVDKQELIKGYIYIPDWLEPEPVRLITSKSNQALIDLVNKILEWEQKGVNIRSITSTNPYHQADRILQIIRSDYNGEVSFTYSASNDAYPFIYLDDNGDVDGFLVDLFTLIQARTGIIFDYVKPKGRMDNNFSAFESDIVPVVYIEQPSQSDWLITEPYLETQFVSLEMRGAEVKNSNKPKGILVNFREQGTIFLTAWKHSDFKKYTSLDELFKALKDREVDEAYIPADITQSMVIQGLSDSFVIGQAPPLKVSLALAINNQNEKLLDLMNAIFLTIDSKEIAKLNRGYRQFSIKYGYQQDQVIKVVYFVAVILVVMLLVTYLYFHNLKLKVSFAEFIASSEEKEKQWLTSIIQELNSMIFIHDEECELVMSNYDAYEKRVCDSDLMRTKKYSLLVEDTEGLKKVLHGSEKLSSSSHEIEESDKKSRYVLIERKLIYSPARERSFVLTILRDITEQKNREKELQKAKRQAQAAVYSRERFLATVSHELRTPIAAIQGLLELMEMPENKDSKGMLLSQSRASLNHLNHMVDEILDFSKLDAEQLRITNEKINLNLLMQESTQSFIAQAKQKELQYLIDIQIEKNTWVLIDSTRLKQIIFNLLSNAFKFTSKGYIRFWCDFDNDLVSIKVIDSGIGMTTEQLNLITQPFVQADDSITRNFGGTGLGLSIVDKLVGLMGGTFSIESEVSIGTTMTITIPIHILDAQQTSTTIIQPKPIESKSKSLVGKVLVAEDNAINQNLIAMQLRNLGVEATIVDNGFIALEYLKKTDYDMVLTDFHMPELDGYGLTRAIKNDEILKHIPVVGITAEDSRVVEKQIMEVGINDVLFKPYGIDSLASMLAKYLSKSADTHLIGEPNWLSQFPVDQRYLMATTLLKTMSEDIETIKGTLTNKTIKQAIHSIKGGTGSVGLNEITKLCADYERASEDTKSHVAEKLTACLESEIDVVSRWVSKQHKKEISFN